jgi:hypothetical protein
MLRDLRSCVQDAMRVCTVAALLSGSPGCILVSLRKPSPLTSTTSREVACGQHGDALLVLHGDERQRWQKWRISKRPASEVVCSHYRATGVGHSRFAGEHHDAAACITAQDVRHIRGQDPVRPSVCWSSAALNCATMQRTRTGLTVKVSRQSRQRAQLAAGRS